jgi:hypothetical protein
VDGWHRQELPVAEGREVSIYMVLSEHQPIWLANTNFTNFAQVRRYQTRCLFLPLVASQPRQRVAWATRHIMQNYRKNRD